MRHLTSKQHKSVSAVSESFEGFYGDLPAGVGDRIRSEVGIRFDWRDRIRILFGWNVEVVVRTNTTNVVGNTRSVSSIRVIVPDAILEWRMRKQRGMYSTVSEKSSEARLDI